MHQDRQRNFKKIALWALVAFIFIFILWHIFKPQAPSLVVQPPPVITQKPGVIQEPDYITQTGNTVAYNSVDLVARVEGYLQEIKFTDGSHVKKGQELFVIEPEPYLEKLREAEAVVAAAKAAYEYASLEYERQQRMYKENATSLNNVQKWLAQKEKAQADLDQTKANETNARINYSYTHVWAPFDGRIGRHLIDPGNLVGSGKPTELATIDQIDPIYVYFNLNELDLIKIRAAARAHGFKPADINKVSVYVGMQNEEGYPREGKLNFASTGLNATTGTLQFRVLLPNKDFSLLPGLFVQVRIPITQAKPRLTVPDTAVQYNQLGAYLLIVDPQEKVVLKQVELGGVEKGIRIIQKGISPQDEVIVEGLQNAIPGDHVTVQKAGGTAV